jgi:hypothetical protein
MGFRVVISITRDVWSPDAVASNMSSDEASRSIMEFTCGRNPRYASVNPASSSIDESSSRIPPSSSPIATIEFADLDIRTRKIEIRVSVA